MTVKALKQARMEFKATQEAELKLGTDGQARFRQILGNPPGPTEALRGLMRLPLLDTAGQ